MGEDAKGQVRLSTIQGVGLSIDEKLEGAKVDMHVARGVIAGLVASGHLTDKVMEAAQKDIDDGKLDGEVAKTVLQYLLKVKEEQQIAVALNQRSLAKAEGIIDGLEKAVQECKRLYMQEETKQQKRENEAERGRRDEGGRPIPIREQNGAS